MGIFNRPLEWATEMNRLMGNGGIKADNYLTDCANAVVYVRETAEANIKLQKEVEELRQLVAFYMDGGTFHSAEKEYQELCNIDPKDRTNDQTKRLVILANALPKAVEMAKIAFREGMDRLTGDTR